MKIHIKKENKGKFNALKKRTGKSTEELTHSKNPLTRKRAIFAQNTAKWDHADGGYLFGEGGNFFTDVPDYQQHGGDFSNGLTFVDTGGTHEQNPYQGVQMGVDNNGTPNKVEQGEAIYNNYVFSNRLRADGGDLEQVNLPSKYKGATFAKIAEDESKESSERPNDPISMKGLEASMAKIKAAQEMIKQRKQQAEMQQALQNMTPEQQAAIAAQMQQQNPEEGEQQPEYPQYGEQPQEGMYGSPEEQQPQEGYAYGGNLYGDGDILVKPKGKNFHINIADVIKSYGNQSIAQLLGTTTKGVYNSANDLGNNAIKAFLTMGYNPINVNWGKLATTPISKLGSTDLSNHFENYFTNTPSPIIYNKSGKAYTAAGNNKPLSTADYNSMIAASSIPSANGTMVNTGANTGAAGVYSGTSKRRAGSTRVRSSKAAASNAASVKSIDPSYIPTLLQAPSMGTPFNTAKPNYPTSFPYRMPAGTDKRTGERGFNNYLRYAPVIGSAIGALSTIASPQRRPGDAVFSAMAGAGMPYTAGPSPIGDYMTYRPLDRNYYLNTLNANNAATRRALVNNSGGNWAAANAGILGADYNYGDSFGKLVRQGEEYNRGLEDTVYKFNQATNLANQNNAMEAQKINAETSMNNRRYMADAYSTAARLNYEDALARDNAISGNFTNLFENLGNIGRENYLSRQVGWKLQKGLDGNYSLGDMGTIQNTYGISDKQLRDWATNQGIDNDSINSYFTNRSNSSKNGGKIRTRRTRRTF